MVAMRESIGSSVGSSVRWDVSKTIDGLQYRAFERLWTLDVSAAVRVQGRTGISRHTQHKVSQPLTVTDRHYS